MNQRDFDATIEVLDSNCQRIMGYKNNNLYAKDTEDRLHNFKIGAEISGLTPAQIAWGYMTKHTAALRDMVLRNDFSNPDELKEKCTDMINYIKFIYCLGMEVCWTEFKQRLEDSDDDDDSEEEDVSSQPQVAVPVHYEVDVDPTKIPTDPKSMKMIRDMLSDEELEELITKKYSGGVLPRDNRGA